MDSKKKKKNRETKKKDDDVTEENQKKIETFTELLQAAMEKQRKKIHYESAIEENVQLHKLVSELSNELKAVKKEMASKEEYLESIANEKMFEFNKLESSILKLQRELDDTQIERKNEKMLADHAKRKAEKENKVKIEELQNELDLLANFASIKKKMEYDMEQLIIENNELKNKQHVALEALEKRLMDQRAVEIAQSEERIKQMQIDAERHIKETVENKTKETFDESVKVKAELQYLNHQLGRMQAQMDNLREENLQMRIKVQAQAHTEKEMAIEKLRYRNMLSSFQEKNKQNSTPIAPATFQKRSNNRNKNRLILSPRQLKAKKKRQEHLAIQDQRYFP